MKSQTEMNKWIGMLIIVQLAMVVGVSVASIWGIRRVFVKQRVN